MLRSRGYAGAMHCSLDGGYHNRPTKYQTTSYGVRLAKAIQRSDKPLLTRLLRAGLSPNACNRFGESIVHATCRRSDATLLRILLAAGSSVQVSDDFGRTPMHDALWTTGPNFECATLLLEEDPWLLCVADCRGSSPLSYVRRANWGEWVGYLGAVCNKYWPRIDNDGHDDEEGTSTTTESNDSQPQRQQQQTRQRAAGPPLAKVEPNTRPVPRPNTGAMLSLEQTELVASGKIDPEDDGSVVFVSSRDDDVGEEKLDLCPQKTGGIAMGLTMLGMAKIVG